MRRLIGPAIVSAALAAALPGGPGRAGASTVPPDDPCAGAAATAPTDAVPALDVQLPLVTLCALPETGAGARPTFAWLAVEGASVYALSVLTADGEPIWAWTGPETSIALGGWDEPPGPEFPGPLLTGPSSWFVVALDTGWVPVAISEMRPITP